MQSEEGLSRPLGICPSEESSVSQEWACHAQSKQGAASGKHGLGQIQLYLLWLDVCGAHSHGCHSALCFTHLRCFTGLCHAKPLKILSPAIWVLEGGGFFNPTKSQISLFSVFPFISTCKVLNYFLN